MLTLILNIRQDWVPAVRPPCQGPLSLLWPEIPYHYRGFSEGEGEVIPRYTRNEMGRVWSETNRFQKWLEVELAASETLAEAGLVPKDAVALMKSRASVDVAR